MTEADEVDELIKRLTNTPHYARKRPDIGWRDPSPMQRDLAEWLAEITGLPIDVKSVQAVTMLHHVYRTSPRSRLARAELLASRDNSKIIVRPVGPRSFVVRGTLDVDLARRDLGFYLADDPSFVDAAFDVERVGRFRWSPCRPNFCTGRHRMHLDPVDGTGSGTFDGVYLKESCA